MSVAKRFNLAQVHGFWSERHIPLTTNAAFGQAVILRWVFGDMFVRRTGTWHDPEPHRK